MLRRKGNLILDTGASYLSLAILLCSLNRQPPRRRTIAKEKTRMSSSTTSVRSC